MSASVMNASVMNPLVSTARTSCAFVGMVHLQPLPGSPRANRSMRSIQEAAMADARALIDGGCDAVLIENMGDVPYLKGTVYPETVAAAAVCASKVAELGLPMGIQLLAGANREALGVAAASGAVFLRVEGFAYAHVADEGWIDASAGPLLRARAALGLDPQMTREANDGIAIWADVQKKHSAHAVTGDLNIAELAQGAAFCGADALIVTGSQTGAETDKEDIRHAQTAKLPIAVGSGVSPSNAGEFAKIADAVIVGTSLKHGEDWRNPVDTSRVRAVRAVIDAAKD